MTPATINPTLIVLNENGKPTATATNIAPIAELNVVIVDTPTAFKEAALGMQFNSTVPVAPTQPLNEAYRKGKA